MKNKIDIYTSNYDLYKGTLTSGYSFDSSSISFYDKSFLNVIYNNFQSTRIFSDNIFPSGILYYDNSIIVFQKPPSKKLINYIPKQEADIRSSDEHTSYEISIPWQVYVISYSSFDYSDSDSEVSSEYYSINSVYMFFSNCQITSGDNYLYSAPIPNFYSNGLLCSPRYSSIEDTLFAKDSHTVSNLMVSAYNSIWNSNYNGDLTSSIVDYLYSCFKKQIHTSKSLFANNILSTYPIYSRTSYYCDLNFVSNFLENWSTYSVSDILSFDWANPSNTNWYHTDYSEIEEDALHQYFAENVDYDPEDFEDEYPTTSDILEMIDYDDFIAYIGGDIRLNNKSLSYIINLIKSKEVNNVSFNSIFSSIYSSVSNMLS
jgi:hypothetical protein